MFCLNVMNCWLRFVLFVNQPTGLIPYQSVEYVGTVAHEMLSHFDIWLDLSLVNTDQTDRAGFQPIGLALCHLFCRTIVFCCVECSRQALGRPVCLPTDRSGVCLGHSVCLLFVRCTMWPVLIAIVKLLWSVFCKMFGVTYFMYFLVIYFKLL